MKTDITIVLDRSGSMQSIAPDTIGGFNKFLEEQKVVPGEAVLTLIQFDNMYEVVHDAVPIKDVPELTSATFKPRGSTALIDSMGRAITDAMHRIAKATEKPDQVIFVIITDGEDNMRLAYTKEQVFKLVTEREEAGWSFTYIGANQDAIATAVQLGILRDKSIGYSANKGGTEKLYSMMSDKIRSSRLSSDVSLMAFNASDRQEQEDAKHGS